MSRNSSLESQAFVKRASTGNRLLSIDMSADYPSTHRPTLSGDSWSTIPQHIGQHVNQELARSTGSRFICRSIWWPSVSRHISQYVDRVSANIVDWYSTKGFANYTRSHESDPNLEQTQPKLFSHGAPWGRCLVWLHLFIMHAEILYFLSS